MNTPPTIHPFWAAFEAASGRDMTSRFYEAFHFDDDGASSNKLAQLVLLGTKRATAALLWSMDTDNKPPLIGDLGVVTGWQGQAQALCVIETRSVEIVPYDQVTEALAALEGEGAALQRYWREAHRAYFGRQCRRIGKEADRQMPLVCK